MFYLLHITSGYVIINSTVPNNLLMLAERLTARHREFHVSPYPLTVGSLMMEVLDGSWDEA